MKERLEEIMKLEKLTSVKIAEILGVQPSNISHIMSGRNNPSYDFITKFIERFPHINAEWIITGKGNIYKSEMTTDFSNVTNVNQTNDTLVNNDTFSVDTLNEVTTTHDNKELHNNTFVMHDVIGKVNHASEATHSEPLITEQNVAIPNASLSTSEHSVVSLSKDDSKTVERIILIYSDNSFEILQN